MTAAQRRRLLWLVAVATLITAGSAILLRYQGLIVPVRVASGSMAPQFLGPHHLVTCAECNFAFCCGLDTEAPLQQAVCPNCGFRHNDLGIATLHAGDRVVVDRWAYVRRTPHRGDVVAFIDPTNELELAVKRVMGLPGEAVTIHHGELFINGQLHRKSLQETKQLATLVYNDAYRPLDERELPPRWASDDAATRWQTTCDGYLWKPEQTYEATHDWLRYRHWRCYASPHPRTEESPVTDNDAYNQGLSRELNEVTDLLLSCEVTLDDDGEVALSIHDGRESFVAVISEYSHTLRLYRDGDQLEQAVMPQHVDSRRFPVEFGVIDEQILFAIAGQTVILHEYKPLEGPLQPTSRPLGIAGRQGECSVANIHVYRDIFYLNPFRGDWAWTGPNPLGADTYFVLGDNAPLSTDSRHWRVPGLPHKQLVGRVLSYWR